MTIPPAEDVWTPEFRERRLVPDAAIRASMTLRGAPRSAAAWLESAGSKPAATLWQPLWWYVDDEAARGPLRAELGQLGFTEPYAAAIAAADVARIADGTVAIHVRAADIVFGRYRRYWVHTPKAVPYAIVDAAIARLRDEGHPVIVFGQERDALDWLSRRPGVAVADDVLGGGLSGAPNALAQMVLMSRCARTVAGLSVFAAIGSSLGGRNSEPIETVVPANEYGAIVDAATDVPGGALAAAHAQLYAFARGEGADGPQASIDRLTQAWSLDPDNALLPIAIAATAGEAGMTVLAEETLAAAAQHDYPEDMGGLDSTVALRMQRWFLLDPLFPALEDLAARGGPRATALWEVAVAAGAGERTAPLGQEISAR